MVVWVRGVLGDPPSSPRQRSEPSPFPRRAPRPGPALGPGAGPGASWAAGGCTGPAPRPWAASWPSGVLDGLVRAEGELPRSRGLAAREELERLLEAGGRVGALLDAEVAAAGEQGRQAGRVGAGEWVED